MMPQGQAREICPTHSGVPLVSAGLFDGDPDDLASLQPDRATKSSGTYTVNRIYQQGRALYVECGYKNGITVTVKADTPLNRCDYRQFQDGSMQFECR